jgi:hypothetical protein
MKLSRIKYMKKILLYLCLLMLPILGQLFITLWFPGLVSNDGRYSLGLSAITSLIVLFLAVRDLSLGRDELINRIFMMIAIISCIVCSFIVIMASSISG